MKTSTVYCTILFVSILVVEQKAWSRPDQTDAMDAPDSPEFQTLYGKARAASSDGNLKEAVRLYKAAYELRPDPVLLYNIARILHKLTRFQEARIYYQMFIDSPAESEEQKKKAQEYLDALKDIPSPAGKSQSGRTPSASIDRGTQSRQTDTVYPASDTASSAQPAQAVSAENRTAAPSSVAGLSSSAGPASAAVYEAKPDVNATPLYRKWWFWTIVGGVAAAGAVGLGVGLSGSAAGPQIPSDAFQYTPTF